MFVTKIRREGDALVVDIPEEEVRALGLDVGETVNITMTAIDTESTLSPELRAIVEEIAEDSRPVMLSLRDR